jgi:ADP-ribose pyrophosphatase YjhB (NUDIX family)
MIRTIAPGFCRSMGFATVTDLREQPHRIPGAKQYTGFDSSDFVGMPLGGREGATTRGTSFSCTRCAGAPLISCSSDFCARPGFVCESCGPSGDRHPRIVVRCVAQHKGRVLLCQRADEPRRGLWNTPGGFLESGEEPRAAVIRETLEESGVSVCALKLGFIHEFPQLNEIAMTFLAELREPSVAPGEESLDSRSENRSHHASIHIKLRLWRKFRSRDSTPRIQRLL